MNRTARLLSNSKTKQITMNSKVTTKFDMGLDRTQKLKLNRESYPRNHPCRIPTSNSTGTGNKQIKLLARSRSKICPQLCFAKLI